MTVPSHPKEQTDEELALKVQAGSIRCFEELIFRHTQKLFCFLRIKMKTDQETEDLTQETFLKAFKNIDKYDPRWKFSTWIYTLAYRLAISHYRSQKNKNLHSIPLKEQESVEETVIKAERIQSIWRTARQLKTSQYEVLWLHYRAGFSIKEISLTVNKSSAAIRTLLHRARLNLSNIIHDESENKKPGISPESIQNIRQITRSF